MRRAYRRPALPATTAPNRETRVRFRHLVAAVVALLLIASLATWMFASEDPPPAGEPALEAGQ